MNLLLTVDQYVANHIYHYVFAECLKQIVPTEIDSDGNFRWKKEGQLHREVGPAVIWTNGNRSVVLKGSTPSRRRSTGHHSMDGINGGVNMVNAIEREINRPSFVGNGYQAWWSKDQLHREGDRPAITHLNGNSRVVFQASTPSRGRSTRLIRVNGDQEWWVNDQRHREGDRPAVIGC